MAKRQKAPGRSDRLGITLFEAVQRFGSPADAEKWLIDQRWSDGVRCPRCNNDQVAPWNHPKSDLRHWRCKKSQKEGTGCDMRFSIKSGSVMEQSKLPLNKWCLAIFLAATSLKGVSSMKLHRDVGITQKSAWHLGQRIRKMFEGAGSPKMEGPAEADETAIGGKEDNKHEWKRLNPGGGSKGKAIVAGIKDRATNHVQAAVIDNADADTLTQFVHQHTEKDALVFTDESHAYDRLHRARMAVKHSVKEYVNGMVHTNGMESFWAVLKRGYVGVYHHFSVKHLQRYVDEFTGRHNIRPLDTIQQMAFMVRNGVGKSLTYATLIGPKHTRQPALIRDWS